jgi:hypothetical protein
LVPLLSQSPENVALFILGYGLADFETDISHFAAASGIAEHALRVIAAIARQGQDPAARKVKEQHVVSRVLLRQFADPTTGLVGHYSVQFGVRPLTGPGGIAKLGDYVKMDSQTTEELWGKTESKLPDAIGAARAGTLFTNPDYVATIKEAIALHYARSLDVHDQHEGLWKQFLDAKRASASADEAGINRLYVLKTDDTTGKPDDAMRETLVTELMEGSTNIFETGIAFRFRVEHYFHEATKLLASANLEVLTPSAGNEFLIGDVPVVTSDASGHFRGINAGVPIGSAKMVALPLGPELLVSLGPNDVYRELDSTYVKRLNTWQIEAAHRGVFFRPGGPAEGLAVQVRPPTGPTRS